MRRTAVLPSWCSPSSSGDHPFGRLDGARARVLAPTIAERRSPPRRSDAHLQGAAGIWRNAFIRMPYAREFLTPAGLINDTFETAITWDQFENLHDKVKAGLRDRAHGARGIEERGETSDAPARKLGRGCNRIQAPEITPLAFEKQTWMTAFAR